MIHPNVSILHDVRIGDRVIIHAGAVLGSDGFGYATDEKGVHHKIPQVGTVVVEDDVEIGANTCIDRARFHETRIGRGTKIDNLVQVGHNVVIGPHSVARGPGRDRRLDACSGTTSCSAGRSASATTSRSATARASAAYSGVGNDLEAGTGLPRDPERCRSARASRSACSRAGCPRSTRT